MHTKPELGPENRRTFPVREVADRIEAMDKRWHDEQILTALVYFLRQNVDVTVDEFIAAYTSLPHSVVMRDAVGRPLVELPARGDLVRLLRKFPGVATCDRYTFQSGTPSAWHPESSSLCHTSPAFFFCLWPAIPV